MKKFLALAIVLGSIVSFSSCKKCYNCNKKEYQYCTTVTVNSPLGNNTFSQCFSDSNQRNGFISAIEGGISAIPVGASAESTKSDTLINDLNQEVCSGNKSNNENFVSLWEEQGYICTEK